MLIFFLKFIHVIFALSLFGGTLYCLTAKHNLIASSTKPLLFMSLLAMLTGTLLVYPKHFTFHTPWIIAAYTLLFLVMLGILFLFSLKKKGIFNRPWNLRVTYFILGLLLLFIIHDAVTKTTFLFH
jgi:hypothetical protein